MNKKQFEQRSYLFEVRAEDNENGSVLTGRPIVYNIRTDLGLFDEIIEPGALDNADLTDVRFLVNHDISRIPLARSRRNNGNSTMQLMPNAFGMDIRVNIDTINNSEARALRSAVDRGDMTGMSFMMIVGNEAWENLESEHPLRRIKAIETVIEVSACTFPAYTSTEIAARSKTALENARSALEKARSECAGLLESRTNELELLKEKTKLLGGMIYHA